MPTTRLLRTTLGSYEVFDLTSTLMSQYVRTVDVSGQNSAGGVTSFFTGSPVHVPYVAGSLELEVNGVLQNGTGFFTETDPATGAFTTSLGMVNTTVFVIRFIAA